MFSIREIIDVQDTRSFERRRPFGSNEAKPMGLNIKLEQADDETRTQMSLRGSQLMTEPKHR